MKVCVLVPSVMRFVDDQQVKTRRRIECRQPSGAATAARRIAVQEVLVEQRIGENCAGVTLRPFSLKIGMVETVSEIGAGEGYEVLIEAPHLLLPLLFNYECFGADDQHRPEWPPSLKLAQQQPRLD